MLTIILLWVEGGLGCFGWRWGSAGWEWMTGKEVAGNERVQE